MNRFKFLIKTAIAIALSYVLCATSLLQPMAVYAAALQAQESSATADAAGSQNEADGDASDEANDDANPADASESETASADDSVDHAAADEGEAARTESLDAEAEQSDANVVIGDSEANSWRYQNGELRGDLEDDNATGIGTGARSMHKMPDGATAQGIDVSGYQKNIDWQKVKDAGIDYAILKIGNINARETDGWYTDSCFQRNMSECERLGIPFGVYAYSYAKNADEAVNGASHIIALLKGHNPTLPVYLDLEDNSIQDTDHAAIATAFCNAISAAGYTPGIYASAKWFKTILTDPCFSNSDWSIWTAQYWYGQRYDASLGLGPENPAKFDCWQYSSLSTVSGIDGNCDINYWYKDGFSGSNSKPYSFTGVKLSKSKGLVKGDTVGISADVSGDTDGLQYKFYWQKQGTGTDAGTSGVIAGPSEKPSAEWTIDEDGTYQVRCDVIDSEGTVTKSTSCTVSRYTVDGLGAPSSARAGQGVSLKARVSGDASGLRYKFVWERDGWKEWGVVGGSAQDSPEATWTPTEPGDYTVTLDVIDGSKTRHATAGIKVYKKYVIKGASLKTEGGGIATVGSNCTIKIESEGDTSGLKYKLVWEKDDWKSWGVVRQFDTSDTCEWVPSVSGSVSIHLDVVDADGAKSTFCYPVSISREQFSYDSLTCDSDLIQQGGTVSVDANTSGQTDFLTYKFVWSRDNWAEWGVAQKGKSNHLNWTPSKPGEYTISCDVIASDGSVLSKAVSFGVWGYNKIVTKSLDNNWTYWFRADLGTSAAEKAGVFKFKFVWANSDWSKWGVLQEASSQSSAHLNPSSLGLTYGRWYVYVDVQYPDGTWHSKSTSVQVGYRGYQNPSNFYQVSCASVAIPHLNQGIFGYRTPSRIGTYATKQDCINAMITRAYDYVGTTPYIWDYSCAPGVGVDCAGLVMQCLYATGMNLGRYTPWDHYYTPGHDHYANDMWNDSRFKHLSFSQRQRGDLICYQGHIAIYIGNDQIIEAASPRYGVRVHSVYVGYQIKGVLRPFV